MDIADIKLAMELFGSNGGKVSVIHLRGHEYPSAGRGFIERTMRDLATRQKTARIGALLSKRQESGNSHKGLFRATWEYRHSFPIEIYTPFGNWASRSFRKEDSMRPVQNPLHWDIQDSEFFGSMPKKWKSFGN